MLLISAIRIIVVDQLREIAPVPDREIVAGDHVTRDPGLMPTAVADLGRSREIRGLNEDQDHEAVGPGHVTEGRDHLSEDRVPGHVVEGQILESGGSYVYIFGFSLLFPGCDSSNCKFMC